jgi:hypothetical protein
MLIDWRSRQETATIGGTALAGPKKITPVCKVVCEGAARKAAINARKC